MSYFLRTERLGFRTWAEADVPLALALWTDGAVMGHMGGPMSAADAEARMRLQMANQNELGFQYWPMFALGSGEHAGCAGLRPFHDRTDVVEVGVHLAPPFWGGRYGEEAARAVIGWAWAHTRADAIVAGHGPHNEHSKALIGRLGFRYTHHEPWGPHGTMHPYYRLERPLSLSVDRCGV